MRTFLSAVASLTLATAALAQDMPSGDYSVSASARIYGQLDPVPGYGTFVSSGGSQLEAYAALNSSRTDPAQSNRGGAEAVASLTRGTVGARTYAEANGYYGPVSPTGAQAHATLWDTMTLYSGGGATSGRIPLQLELDGNTSWPQYEGGGGSTASTLLKVWDADSGLLLTEQSMRTLTGGLSLNAELDLGLFAPLTSRRIKVYYHLSAYSNITRFQGSTEADFMHTLHFRWDLPTGLVSSSASGVFNPPPTQAVPEPASMAILGVGAIGVFRRRRKAHAG